MRSWHVVVGYWGDRLVREGGSDQPATCEERQQAEERVHEPSVVEVAVVEVVVGISHVKERNPGPRSPQAYGRPPCDQRIRSV